MTLKHPLAQLPGSVPSPGEMLNQPAKERLRWSQQVPCRGLALHRLINGLCFRIICEYKFVLAALCCLIRFQVYRSFQVDLRSRLPNTAPGWAFTRLCPATVPQVCLPRDRSRSLSLVTFPTCSRSLPTNRSSYLGFSEQKDWGSGSM